MNFVQSLNQIFTTNNYEDQDDRGWLKWYVKIYHPLKNFIEFSKNINVLDKSLCEHGHISYTGTVISPWAYLCSFVLRV